MWSCGGKATVTITAVCAWNGACPDAGRPATSDDYYPIDYSRQPDRQAHGWVAIGRLSTRP